MWVGRDHPGTPGLAYVVVLSKTMESWGFLQETDFESARVSGLSQIPREPVLHVRVR